MYDVEVRRGDRRIATGKTYGAATNENGAREIRVFDLEGAPPTGYLTLVLTEDRGGDEQVFERCQVSRWVNDEAVFYLDEPERVSDRLALCKAAKKNFDTLLKQLRFKVRVARSQVETRAKDEAQKCAFTQLAACILEGHWGSVRPSTARRSMTKPFADTADTVVFDPANWSGIIDDPMAIARRLEGCREAYRRLRGLYHLLSAEARRTLFPDGLPEP